MKIEVIAKRTATSQDKNKSENWHYSLTEIFCTPATYQLPKIDRRAIQENPFANFSQNSFVAEVEEPEYNKQDFLETLTRHLNHSYSQSSITKDQFSALAANVLSMQKLELDAFEYPSLKS